MTTLLVVGIGGFIGAIARYGLSGLVHRYYDGPFPAGTLVVNVLGCLAIGAGMTLVEDRQMFSASFRAFLMIGILGSLTTFSTLGYEAVEQLREGALRSALANLLANVVLGVGAVVLGRIAIRMLAS